MKKIVLVLLLTVSFGYSQNCKYKKNEVDEFTGSKVIITKDKIFTKIGMGFGTYAIISAKKINDTKYLAVSFSSNTIFTLRKGSLVMFKTENDEIIELSFSESMVADYSSSQVGTTNITRWTAKMYFLLSDELVQKFNDIRIKKVRWYTTDGYVEKDVKKKNSKNISKLLNCIK